MERYTDFRKKEVINICDGEKMGFTSDLELDLRNGRILKLVVTKGNRVFDLFNCPEERIINWNEIKRIGEDTILVEPRGFRRG